MLRFTSLGLQMRGAVESRRLVQLDGVNANGVVAVAWIVSSFMASLAGVLLAPIFGAVQAQTTTSRSRWRRSPRRPGRCSRSMPIAAGGRRR